MEILVSLGGLDNPVFERSVERGGGELCGAAGAFSKVSSYQAALG